VIIYFLNFKYFIFNYINNKNKYDDIKYNMSFVEKFNKYNNLIHDDIYHSKIGSSNILFIGGCRSIVYAIFFEEICKYVPYFKHAQFGFSVIASHIIDLLRRQKTQNICFVFENADFIVCEQIRNYSFLNTSKHCEQNIYNSFKIKDTCKIIQIPNLEFRYFYNEIKQCNIDDNINEIKLKNLNRFIEHCKKYNFNNLASYISAKINNERLFITFNHPCNNIILELIKELCENLFEQKLLEPIIDILKQIKIFEIDEIHKTTIDKIDYEMGINNFVK